MKNQKIESLKEQRAELVTKSITLKQEYLTRLLTELDQPHMVFDNKIFVIPTTSPMFELLPFTSHSNGDFRVWVPDSSGDDFESKNVDNYVMLLIDLTTYKIDKVKDTVEYIRANEPLI